MKKMIVFIALLSGGALAAPVRYGQLTPPSKQSGGFNVGISTFTGICFDDATCQSTAGGAGGSGLSLINGSLYSQFAGKSACLTGNVGIGLDGVLGSCTAPPVGADTCIGDATCAGLTTGQENTAYGYQALTNNQSGYENLAVGVQALQNITYGTDEVAVGPFALQGLSGAVAGANTAVGHFSGNGQDGVSGYRNQLTAGGGNTFIGSQTGVDNTNGIVNYGTAIGIYAYVGCNNCGSLGAGTDNSVYSSMHSTRYWGVNYSTPTYNFQVMGSSGAYTDAGITLGAKTSATIRASTPNNTWQQVTCSDCSTVSVCISTGTSAGQWALLTNKGSACN